LASSSSTSPEASRRIEYVGFWKRLVAMIIDTLLLLVVIVPLLIAIYGLQTMSESRGLFAGFWGLHVAGRAARGSGHPVLEVPRRDARQDGHLGEDCRRDDARETDDG
jgi:hypothetical protein